MHKSTLRAEQRRLERLREEAERDAFKKRNEEFQRARERRTDFEHICLIGELRPQVDADNLHDALVVALRFAKAYRLESPVIVGETTLLDLERRVYYEALRTRLPWLCSDGTLSERVSHVEETKPFDNVWVPLPDSRLPISQEQLGAAMAEIANPKG